jgi:outer membrane protein OmpA-like peptidoglycan-associated protein
LVVLTAVTAVVLISTSAFSQSDSTPKWDVFAGYQYLNPGGTVPLIGDPNNPVAFKLPGMEKGAGGAFTYNFAPHAGLETDFGYNWGSNASEWTIGAGPRFMVRGEGYAAFVHVLGTLNRVSYSSGAVDNNGIGIIAGGGLDIPFTKMFSWRLFQADYVWASHNYAGYASPAFPSLRHPNFEGARLRTGIVLNWGGAPELVPAASCSVQPTEVMVGEPITATVTASNFNPKHTVTYSWSGNGGQVTGKDTTASIDTANAAPGSYAVTAHVTDPKAKKNNEASCTANYTIKPLPPKNPPTMSCSASSSNVQVGGSGSITCTCTSPDGVPVSVASWTSTGGSVLGSGNTATLNTSGASPGAVTVGATCTDSRGLTAQASTQLTIENPPPPPVDTALEGRLALHSVYFQTAQPSPKDPNAGLLPSQQKILVSMATDFKKYLETKPEAHLTLEGHADIRGSDAYNQALSERRVARVKSFLIEQGIPASDIDTKAYGKQKNLTTQEVKDSVEKNPDLTTEERKRALARITVIRMASNRRVDITLTSLGQSETSAGWKFPFNAADALSLIGGREAERKTTAKPAPKKKPVKKP